RCRSPSFPTRRSSDLWHDAYLLLQRGFSYRPELWRAGTALLLENPFWGLGFQDFKLAVPGLKTLYNHPHNLFLDIGIRLGLVGLDRKSTRLNSSHVKI